jgi:hypothetical protein
MRLTDRDAASRYRPSSIGLDSRTWRFQRLESLAVCNTQNVTVLCVIRRFEHIKYSFERSDRAVNYPGRAYTTFKCPVPYPTPESCLHRHCLLILLTCDMELHFR